MSTHHTDLPHTAWHKASYSNGYGGDCIEVATLPHGHRALRDSKNPTGPTLTITPTHWTAFLTAIHHNHLH
ncbi:MAG: DUF397 domain-containing protein [Micromonosporaceae bacterium]